MLVAIFDDFHVIEEELAFRAALYARTRSRSRRHEREHERVGIGGDAHGDLVFFPIVRNLNRFAGEPTRRARNSQEVAAGNGFRKEADFQLAPSGDRLGKAA